MRTTRQSLFSFIVFFLCIAFITPVCIAADYQELIKKADALYEQRNNLEKAFEAIDVYRQAMEAAPENAEPKWKFARAIYFVTLDMEDEKREPLLDETVKIAEQATSQNPDCIDCYYWEGAINGTYGQVKGVLQSLFLVEPIKKSMSEVLKRNPNYEDGGAYLIMGRLYHAVPGFFGGSKKKAKINLEKAVSLGPKKFLGHVYLADLYIDLDEFDKAKELLDYVDNEQCREMDERLCKIWRKMANDLRAKMEDKMN